MKTIVLKILILGGTNFLGPHLVEELQEHGHEVTLFNRGTQDSSRFPNVEILHGDRDGNLDTLKNRWWDAIIDTSGHLPGWLKIHPKYFQLLQIIILLFQLLEFIGTFMCLILMKVIP